MFVPNFTLFEQSALFFALHAHVSCVYYRLILVLLGVIESGIHFIL